ncbi:MAG: phosphoserine phosphatase SerB [Pseudomonadota bacterium]
MAEDIGILVLTLVSADSKALDDDVLAEIADHLSGAEPPDWLAAQRACDIRFVGPLADDAQRNLQAALREVLSGRPIDVAVQPPEGRRKRLLIADMDSTIVVGETLDDLAAHAGLKPKIAEITARAMRGELEFKGALRERVALLAGLRETALSETYERLEVMPGAATLVATMKSKGAYAALVSGGFNHFTSRVRESLGFDEDSANDLEIADGRLTGKVVEPIRDRDAKRATLMTLCQRLDIPQGAALAVGDGANDLDMIAAAGMGVAFKAKPAVRAAARFAVDHGDLTTLLYYQGYRLDEFSPT